MFRKEGKKEKKREKFKLNYLNLKNRKITVKKAKAKNKSEDVRFYVPATIY